MKIYPNFKLFSLHPQSTNHPCWHDLPCRRRVALTHLSYLVTLLYVYSWIPIRWYSPNTVGCCWRMALYGCLIFASRVLCPLTELPHSPLPAEARHKQYCCHGNECHPGQLCEWLGHLPLLSLWRRCPQPRLQHTLPAHFCCLWLEQCHCYCDIPVMDVGGTTRINICVLFMHVLLCCMCNCLFFRLLKQFV